jgi:hypothetical protein
MQIYLNSDEVRTLKSFLKPKVATGWGISRIYFSNPSWNLMCRALIKVDLIPKKTEIRVIQIQHLSEIFLGDIIELKHAGTHRVSQLILELQQLEESISQDFDTKKYSIEVLNSELSQEVDLYSDFSLVEKSAESMNLMTLEASLVVRIVNNENWRNEFQSEFGYPFEELEFDEESISRNLEILSERLDGLTLDEIGKNNGVTRERIRQVIEKQLAKAEIFSELIDFNLREKFENRLRDNKNAPKIIDQQKRAKLELDARKIIDQYPGISWSELSEELNVEEEILRKTLHKHTKKFIFNESRTSGNKLEFSNEEILEALRLAEAFESPINRNLYDDLVVRGLIKGPGSQTVMHRFGTWNKACKLANVEFNESVRESYESLWTTDEILNYLVEFLMSRTYGVGIESYDQWRIETLSNAPSGAHLRNIFNSWAEAKNEALKKMKKEKKSPNLLS